MKQWISRQVLLEFLSQNGVPLNMYQLNQLDRYQQLIRSWSKKHNLLSANDVRYMPERHIFPSLYLSSLLGSDTGKRVLDIGSGAGFPGVVIKIVRPDLDVTLVDSARKKYLFLSEINENLKLSCRVVNDRVESWLQESGETYDSVVSRAVTTLEELWLWAGQAMLKNGCFYVLKGGDLATEILPLESLGVNIAVFTPGKAWLELSAHLKGKVVVKMERVHV